MPIRYVSGDLFHNAHDAQAFAHGCNCQGSMGAGIAKNFRARYPEMYEEYRRRCKAEPRQFNLGECWLSWPEKGTQLESITRCVPVSRPWGRFSGRRGVTLVPGMSSSDLVRTESHDVTPVLPCTSGGQPEKTYPCEPAVRSESIAEK